MDKFEFSRDWTNKDDFPTFEDSEERVRQDLQFQPNEIKAYLHRLVDTLASKTGVAEIGCPDAMGNPSTVAVQLASLVAIKQALDTLLETFNGVSVSQSVDSSTNKVPTSKAVQDAISAIVVEKAGGDMAKRVYDPDLHACDIFAYADSAVSGHANNHNNPHAVTKSQIGLENVDNTSDVDKPISTAVQAALNEKFGAGAVIPVISGGTGATTKATARANLGISSGTAAPTGGQDGDIYIQYKA